jgi:hypothetical protein
MLTTTITYSSSYKHRYHNDLHVFNLDTRTWHSHTLTLPAASTNSSTSKSASSSSWPSPRSGFQMLVHESKKRLVLYGGYATKTSVDSGESR